MEMQAKGLLWAVSVDASFQIKLNEFCSSQKLICSFDQGISGIAEPKLPKADGIIQFALDFASLPLTAPVIISFETEGYEHVPSIFGTHFDRLANNRDLIVVFNAELGRLKQLQNDISCIKEAYSFYGDFNNDTILKSVDAEVEEDLYKVERLIERYFAAPTEPNTPPVLTSLTRGTPKLQYVTDTSPEFGGNGGYTKCNDVNTESYFAQGTRIGAISMAYLSNIVTGLGITYTSDNGLRTVIHGSYGEGQETSMLLLSPREFVTKITGSYGIAREYGCNILANLRIYTSDGRCLATTSGMLENKFEWNVPEGCFVMGFAGKCGGYVDKLQVIYGRFLPARWYHSRESLSLLY
ncbi:hypothetical protein O6H91_12G052700 [Diphasiastrum complanatum]|uniref:Uncharacterized protein n=1 Tax=Diphasiastrum complanatum TaxID=34168 RepID=A0ACC2C2D9_DIPCM|nr:hypothetical protein O6H91_12G052700 [Diphasiastrum complanatum]